LENYQGAAKLAALDRHYHLALAYQLKALTLATLEFGIDAEKHRENQCTNFNRETDEKHLSSKKTFAESSNETTNTEMSSDNSNEDKIRSTNFPHNSDMVNEAKDNNLNPLILKCKEQLKAHVTNVNSSHIPFENGSDNNKTEVTENIVTNSNMVNEIIVSAEAFVNANRNTEDTVHCDKDYATVNKEGRSSSFSDTADHEDNIINTEDQSCMISVPQNRNYKKEIVTEADNEKGSESVTEVGNRNQRNSELDLLYKSEDVSETNQVLEDSHTIKNRSRVEFSDEIYVQLNEDLKLNSKLPLIQSSTGEMKPELDIEKGFKLEDSDQETDFVATPTDHVSRKTQVFPVEEEGETSSSVSTPESLTSANIHDSEMRAFAVQGGTEQMSEGHHLTSPDSSTSLVSEEQGPISPESSRPQVYEQSSHSADMNLSPINENRDFQNSVAVCFHVDKEKKFEQRKENTNKCETELIGDLPSLLHSDMNSNGDSGSFSIIQKKNVLEESDLNLRLHNDVEEPESNFDAIAPVLESNIFVAKQKEGVKNEDREMKNEPDNISHEFQNNRICDQKNTSECKPFAPSESLNKTVGKLCNLKQELISSDLNNIIFNSNTCIKVVDSDYSKFEHMVDLALKSPGSKDEADDSVLEEKLTTCSKKTVCKFEHWLRVIIILKYNK
jgi:hypothetical protein